MLPCLDLPLPALSVSGLGLVARTIPQATSSSATNARADANQFIEIQDSMWAQAGEAESTDETEKPADP